MNELVKIIPEKYGIEESKAKELYSNLPQILSERDILEKQFNEVIKLDIENSETWKQARELRLLISKNRTKGILVWHKTTKDYFLKGGQFVDAIKKKEIAVNEKMESDLEEIEKYEQIQEQKRLLELQNKRVKELTAYVENAAELDLSGMDCDVWEAYFQVKKKAFEDEQQRIEEEQKAEEERQRKISLNIKRREIALPFYQFWTEYDKKEDFSVLKESEFAVFLSRLKSDKEEYDKEQEAIRRENERLQKEREELAKKAEVEKKEHERLAKIEAEKRQKLEAERKVKEEKIKAEYEAKVRAEREEKERIQKELEAKDEAERKAKAEYEVKLQAELDKGDAEKVKDLIADLQVLKEKYYFKSKKNQKMYMDVKYLIDKIVAHILK